ncbi:MAG: SH3 domain-containing protein [Candidatus Omnitrophica bacterium]|nr:SH3 domain-containing protein [Candidatus Omnitrophota bacterium]MCF7887699.1 SH3 domain-containing protein [Candidatus Omnitrophota bacterium]
MYSTKIFLLAFVLVACLIFPLTASDKTYKVTKQGVNIRLDSTSLSDSIGTLSSQDKIKVIDEKYDWYKIKLPARLSCWVWSEFIKTDGKNRGEVEANNLNIRNQPSLDGKIIGSLDKNDKIKIKSKKKDWLEVSCYPHAYGWVHSKLLVEATQEEKTINPYKRIAGLSQKGKDNPELISCFFGKVKSGSLENSALYLDVLENIILEDSHKVPFYYLAEKNKLSDKIVQEAYNFLQRTYNQKIQP